MSYGQNQSAPVSGRRLGCLEWSLIALVTVTVIVGAALLLGLGAIFVYEEEKGSLNPSGVIASEPSATPLVTSGTPQTAGQTTLVTPIPIVEASTPQTDTGQDQQADASAPTTQSTPILIVDPDGGPADSAQDEQAGDSGPTVTLDPPNGPPGSTVTVEGTGWPAGAVVTAFLVPASPPQFAIGNATVNDVGSFSFDVLIPSDSRWLNESPVPIVVSSDDQLTKAQALLNITSPQEEGSEEPIEIIVVPVTTATPAVPAPAEDAAGLQAKVNLNVRSGPGVDYPVVGVLYAGEQAPIIGRNVEANWWQIEYPAAAEGSGWVSAQYVDAWNFDGVPVVTVLPPPPTPTPAPAPPPDVIITEWLGEYFDNRNLTGSPVLVRNDPYISFDWGLGSPSPSIPVDNFSVRWTRTMDFAAATYRFYARVDDGVRLWVDNSLIIDQWVEGSVRTLSADMYLTEGPHSIRMEYFEATQYAVAILSWQQVQYYPDWQADYFNNPDLAGNPVLVRNESSINYNWNGASPAPGVSGENFSVRWTRAQYFDGGDYTFYAQSDDGVRVWIGDDLIIDHWQDGISPSLQAQRSLSAGTYQLRVEYYQRLGGSFVGFSWQRAADVANPPVAVIRGPSTGTKGEPVDYSGSRSYSDAGIVRYEWSFGDGKYASGKKVSHTFSSTGTYTIKLTVTDKQGQRDSTKITTKIEKEPDPDIPPVPVIDGPDYAKTGEEVTFDSERSIAYATIVARDWYFGDGTDGTGEQVTHTYNDSGTFGVVLTLVDENGLRGSADHTIDVEKNIDPGEAPKPVITSPDAAQVGQPVTFDASNSTATNPIVSFAWTFGDGGAADALTVDHIYDGVGKYNVRLTLTDDKGLTGTTDKLIEIEPAPTPGTPPVAHITAPDEANVGESVTFDGSGSQSDVPITDYEWDFGDGTTGTGVTADHTYSSSGPFTVRLKVTNDREDSGDTTKEIQIDEVEPTPAAPQAVITAPDKGQVDESLTFDASASKASAPIIEIKWDFGDGDSSDGLTVAHTYEKTGTYSAILTLVDQAGQTDSTAKNVEILDEPDPDSPPVAVIAGRSAALVGESVVFDASGSYGSSPLTAIDWDFGDGTTGSGASVSHAYSAEGSYIVTLTVTDQDGRQGSAQSPITVSDVAPTPTPTPTGDQPVQPGGPPQAVIDAPSQAEVGADVIFDGSLSHGSSSLVQYQWATGDGATGSAVAIVYTYNNPGTYQATLTVTDEDGQTNTATHEIVITMPGQPTEQPVQPTEQPAQPTQQPGQPTEQPAPPVQPTEQPAPPVQPTEQPAPPVQPTEQPAPPVQPTEQPAPPVQPTEQPAPPVQPTEQPVPTAVQPTEQPAPTAVQPTEQPAPPPVQPTEQPTPEPQPAAPPVASISGPDQVQAEVQITFDASGSSGSAPIVDYQWAFGDGGTGSGAQVSYSYAAEGSYEVTLTVVDQNGLTNTTSMTVHVAPSQAQIDAEQEAEQAAQQAAQATAEAQQAEADATAQAEQAAEQAAADATAQAEQAAQQAAADATAQAEQAAQQAAAEATAQAEQAAQQAAAEATAQAEQAAQQAAAEATAQAEQAAQQAAAEATAQAEQAAQQAAAEATAQAEQAEQQESDDQGSDED